MLPKKICRREAGAVYGVPSLFVSGAKGAASAAIEYMSGMVLILLYFPC